MLRNHEAGTIPEGKRQLRKKTKTKTCTVLFRNFDAPLGDAHQISFDFGTLLVR